MAEDNKQGYFNIAKYLISCMPKTSFAAIYIIFCCAVFGKFFTTAEHLIICIGTAGFCGYEIIIGAYRAICDKRYLHPDVYLSVAFVGTFLIGMYYEAIFAAAVFAICRSVISTLQEWMEHKYSTEKDDYIPDNMHKSATEKSISNAVTVFSVISLFAILVLSVIIPFFWRVQFISWLRRAFILLTAACPGAITISAYVEYYKCLNSASEQGIVYKSRNTIEEAARVTSVVFGKIELIPGNRYCIDSIEPVQLSKNDLLLLAAYACSFSADELSETIVRESGINVDISKVEMFKNIPEYGSAIILGGVKVLAGNAELMTAFGIDIGDVHSDPLCVYISAGGRFAGRIILKSADSKSVDSAITHLSNIDIDRVMLLTSSLKSEAYVIAEKLGITEVWAEMSADERKEKLHNLRQMQLENEYIAFVADSAGDAELAKEADISISVGEAASVIETDIHIPDGDYTKIPVGFRLSRTLVRNIRHNLIVACTLKAISILLAVFGLAGIWSVAVIDALATVIVLKGKKGSKYNT